MSAASPEPVRPTPAPRRRWRDRWAALWPVLSPLLVFVLIYALLHKPLQAWLHGQDLYDEEAMTEWLREARVSIKTLPELVNELLHVSADITKDLQQPLDFIAVQRRLAQHFDKREEIEEQLRSLGSPPTKIYTNMLPLFPVIFRLEVAFDKKVADRYDPRLDFQPLVWDADLPTRSDKGGVHQYRELVYPLKFNKKDDTGVRLVLRYHLHAYQQQQIKEREAAALELWLPVAGSFLAFLFFLWIYVNQRREQLRSEHRYQAEQRLHQAERSRLEEELRRQEAEKRQQEAERRHLEEELRRQEAEREKQEAERQALELKSQMFHNIGVMAKSYAHNIKNLLVRPNELLRRCLEAPAAAREQAPMLHEIQGTLGTVTERLQEILQTVQRDPSKFERVRVDLNALVRELHKAWAEQALDKWKMFLDLEVDQDPSAVGPTPLWVEGDRSHLQQTLENLLFNARDAISEMRNHLRRQARPDGTAGGAGKSPLGEQQRQALIAAAGWKGRVVIRTRRDGNRPVLEVQDNGIGMSEETRLRCTETNFSTKRNNALYAGLSAGMGLGLSFVTMILQQHGATLEIESRPQQGALFRVRFAAPAAE